MIGAHGNEVVRLAAPAMGTRFELVLVGEDSARLRSAGEEALAEVVGLSDRLSAFSPASMLSYVNANAAAGAVAVDRELFELLCFCREGWIASEGAFDITIGPLMKAWGFRAGKPASPQEIEAARACVGMDKVELDCARGTVRFTSPRMRLDLGGVAKGHALDLAGRILRAAGVERALMHGGTSSVLAIASPPDEDGWRVRVEGSVVPLRDTALSVSAPRGRTVETESGPLGHVLDPRLGAPTRGAEVAWAVCEAAAWAEVWSTSLLVLKERPASMPESIQAGVILSEQSEVCA